MQATIYKIDRLNTHNGPGFRTVIYFKGCPLHCTWCHNPEGISPKKEVWFNATKCIGCGTCVEMCPEKAMTLNATTIRIDRNLCSGCQLCTMVCPSQAMEKIGEDYSVDDVMKLVIQDQYLFESSKGGITVTGGEPGNHPDFIAELFKRCQKEGIHTAFDTSGMLAESSLETIIPFTDLVFLDIKVLHEHKSTVNTGLPLAKLRQSIKWLNDYQNEHNTLQIEIRTPLVPGITDDAKNLKDIANLIDTSFIIKPNWELCMFNDLCEDKYIRLNKSWGFKGKKHNQVDYKRFLEFKQQSKNHTISITGFVEKKD